MRIRSYEGVDTTEEEGEMHGEGKDGVHLRARNGPSRYA